MEPQFESLPREVVEKTLYNLDATEHLISKSWNEIITNQEVMKTILNYFDMVNRQTFLIISKSWNKTITNLYGVTLRVHNLNLQLMLACEASSITGYFQSLTIPLPMNDTRTNFLSRLTSLTFTGVIVCYNIFPVFEQCQEIRKLEFINCIANQNVREYQLHLEDPSKLLPSLRTLVIKLRYSPFPSTEINFFKRLLPFFTSESGKLDTIVLDCPCRFGAPVEISFDKIFQKNSIRVNPGDLMSERMLDEGKIADEFYNPLLLKNFHTLRNLEMADGGCASNFKMKFCAEHGREDFSTAQFSDFEHVLYCSDLRQNFSSTIESAYMSLTNLLYPQTHLTKLSVTASRALPMNQIYTIANRNAETLKSLAICFQAYEECLDAVSISQLHVLQNLKYSYLETHLPETSASVIENWNYLPSSLRALSTSAIICFDCEDDFNMAAFQHLQKLETFELLVKPFFLFGRFGEIRIREMGPQRIRQLISWLPSLKKLVLRNIHRRGQFGQFDNPRLVTDSLPDTATDWINNESGISFQKCPIVIESRNPKENAALIGQPVGWETINLPTINPIELPAHFDGVIRIQPEFRRNSQLNV